jgi:hypothetical protein
MLAVMLAAAICGGPAPDYTTLPAPTRHGRLRDYISRINPAAHSYAGELAGAILHESRRWDLDPHLMTAIVWTESYFQRRAPGSSGERGAWQIMPGLSYLPRAYDALRAAMGGLPGYPPDGWETLSREWRETVLRDLTLSTYLAAYLMAYHRRRCSYPTTATCYARYNSGGARVRWGYVRRLARRAAHVRRRVDADIP